MPFFHVYYDGIKYDVPLLGRTEKISDARKRISAVIGLVGGAKKQAYRLLYRGKVLLDHQNLFDCDVATGSVVIASPASTLFESSKPAPKASAGVKRSFEDAKADNKHATKCQDNEHESGEPQAPRKLSSLQVVIPLRSGSASSQGQLSGAEDREVGAGYENQESKNSESDIELKKEEVEGSDLIAETCEIKLEEEVCVDDFEQTARVVSCADTDTLTGSQDASGDNKYYWYDEDDCESCRTKKVSPAKCDECGCIKCSARKWQPNKNVMCSECNRFMHLKCAGLEVIPQDHWYCPNCINMDTVAVGKKKGGRGGASTKWGRGISCAGTVKYDKLPVDHVGKIPGVFSGQTWLFRNYCASAGVHRPLVAGIHGSSKSGAVSLVISGGYEDDRDDGDEFLYTGCGGRDLKKLGKNLRSAPQSCDQVLEKQNLALAVTCDAPINKKKGGVASNWRKSRAVRVVRSFRAQRLNAKVAPAEGYRYDGLYRLVKYYPETGQSGFIVWRFLFRRDDDEPAPWTPEGIKRTLELGLTMVRGDNATLSSTVKWVAPKELDSLIKNDSRHAVAWQRFQEEATDITSVPNALSTIFVCLVCLDPLKLPMTPPCGHSMCDSCLKNFIETTKKDAEEQQLVQGVSQSRLQNRDRSDESPLSEDFVIEAKTGKLSKSNRKELQGECPACRSKLDLYDDYIVNTAFVEALKVADPQWYSVMHEN